MLTPSFSLLECIAALPPKLCHWLCALLFCPIKHTCMYTHRAMPPPPSSPPSPSPLAVWV